MLSRCEEVPIAKARHRTCRYGRKMRTYDPQSEDKSNSKWKFTRGMRAKGYLKASDGALHVDLYFGIPLPLSWSQKKRKRLLGTYCTTRPDLDNYIKYYCDVMNGIAYHDDKQIASVISKKVYSEKPYVEIALIPLL